MVRWDPQPPRFTLWYLHHFQKCASNSKREYWNVAPKTENVCHFSSTRFVCTYAEAAETKREPVAARDANDFGAKKRCRNNCGHYAFSAQSGPMLRVLLGTSGPHCGNCISTRAPSRDEQSIVKGEDFCSSCRTEFDAELNFCGFAVRVGLHSSRAPRKWFSYTDRSLHHRDSKTV